MTNQNVQLLLAMYQDKIPDDKVFAFKTALENASDGIVNDLAIVTTYNTTTTILLSVFLGGIGVDRMYIGDVGLGVAKFFVGWLTFGIWPLVDIFFCYKKAKQKNFEFLMQMLSTAPRVFDEEVF